MHVIHISLLYERRGGVKGLLVFSQLHLIYVICINPHKLAPCECTWESACVQLLFKCISLFVRVCVCCGEPERRLIV